MNSIPGNMKHYSARWLIFTDLDGTLLDRRYDLEAAADVMDSLHQDACLCVPASSKTQAEMAELNNFRKFPSPYIFENGGGLSWPSATAPEIIGRSADEISDLLDYIRDEHLFNFRLFRDISVVEIAGRTGLTEGERARPRLDKPACRSFGPIHGISRTVSRNTELHWSKGGKRRIFQTVLDSAAARPPPCLASPSNSTG